MTAVLTAAAAAAWAVAMMALAAFTGVRALGFTAVGLTALPLAWTAAQLGAHRASAAREEQVARERQERARQWLAHAWELGPLPPIDTASRDALADLIEVTTGDAAFTLRDLYVKQGLLQLDIDEVSARERATRLAAIARLARVRHSGALRALLLAARSKDSQTVREALRAMARTVALAHRVSAVDQMVSALYVANLSSAEVEALLPLAGAHAARICERLIIGEDHRYVLAAIRAVGRLRLTDQAWLLSRFLGTAANPRLRAAAFTSVAETGAVHPGLEDHVVAALLGRDEAVAAAAARVAARVPDLVGPPLRQALASAGVAARRCAVAQLDAQGPQGREIASTLLAGQGRPPRSAAPLNLRER